ncbi:MAG: tyrosine-protein phosphatase [Treponema sp.]|nr:tyrosine-protein phosphatase [Treponema sp.]
MGNIAPGILYRSSHPIKDLMQEKTISILANNARIAAVLNLCDNSTGISSKAFFAPWYNSLLNKNKVIALDMDFSVTNDRFKRKLKEGLKFIIDTEGPWLVHCHAGVDRTGFVCMVLEAFMGAKLDDVIDDYLLSFNSIFKSSIYEAQKADLQVAMKLLSVMSDSITITEQNLQQIAEIYLLKKIGLSPSEIELLKEKLADT